MLMIEGQQTTLQPGDIAKVEILGFGLSKVFFLRDDKLITEKRPVEREHHVIPALDEHAAYVGLHLVALCTGLKIKKREDLCGQGFHFVEFIAPEPEQAIETKF